VHWNNNTDTPLPPEEPAGQNPPDGALIDYYLKSDASEVKLEILDRAGKLVRGFSSSDKPEVLNADDLPYPTYWFRPPQVLSASAGMQRFVWDLHYAPPEGMRRSYPMTAISHNTTTSPVGPWVQPGEYSVRLTVDGKSFTQPMKVKLDPRVKIPPAALKQQFELSMICYEGLQRVRTAREHIRALRLQVESLLKKENLGALKDALDDFEKKAALIDGTGKVSDVDIIYFSPSASRAGQETLAGLQTKLLYLMTLFQSADARPTSQAVAAVRQQQASLKEVLGSWSDLRTRDLKRLNDDLRKANLSPLSQE
jgi:hypothetical protein